MCPSLEFIYYLKALRNLLNRARYLRVRTLGSQSSFSDSV